MSNSDEIVIRKNCLVSTNFSKNAKHQAFSNKKPKKACNTNDRPTLATYGRLAVATNTRQVSYSYLLDNKLSTGIHYVAISWQLPHWISCFLNFGPLMYYKYSTSPAFN